MTFVLLQTSGSHGKRAGCKEAEAEGRQLVGRTGDQWQRWDPRWLCPWLSAMPPSAFHGKSDLTFQDLFGVSSCSAPQGCFPLLPAHLPPVPQTPDSEDLCGGHTADRRTFNQVQGQPAPPSAKVGPGRGQRSSDVYGQRSPPA